MEKHSIKAPVYTRGGKLILADDLTEKNLLSRLSNTAVFLSPSSALLVRLLQRLCIMSGTGPGRGVLGPELLLVTGTGLLVEAYRVVVLLADV